MADSLYWIWFQLVFDIGSRRAELMMNYFGEPIEIARQLERGSKVKDMLSPAESKRIGDALRKAENIQNRTLKKGCFIVTPEDEEYPVLLRDIYARPAVLYGKGDISCLKDRLCIGIVGSRAPSEYAVRITKMIATGLAASGVTIVSGLANGVDSAAHRAALDAGGKTVGFLGCGLDIDYPKDSGALKRDICGNGAVVTEFPLGMGPRPHHFPIRNRIVSGVSHGLVVTEAGATSGALVTADHALDQGRDLFAVPGSVLSSRFKGTHKLLRDGARLASCAADILIEYPDYLVKEIHATAKIELTDQNDGLETELPQSDKQAETPPVEITRRELPAGLSEQAETVYPLIGGSPVSVERIAGASALGMADILSALTELEIYGMIRMRPGRMFELAQ